jgi:uncharacterized protein (DUF3084 family)
MSVKRISIALLATVIITGFGTVAIKDAARTKDNLKFQDVEIRTRQTELEEWNEKYDQLNKNLDTATEQKGQNQEEVKRLQTEKEELEKQKKDLEAQLQAKIENKRKLAEASSRVANAVTATQPTYASAQGSCSSWMSQAGISNPTAVVLIGRESGCKSNAVNPSSYACGIAQELLEPNQRAEQIASVNAGYCPKSKCSLQDPVCQLKWMQSYVYGRYGTWENAKAHHDRKNWY